MKQILLPLVMGLLVSLGCRKISGQDVRYEPTPMPVVHAMSRCGVTGRQLTVHNESVRTSLTKIRFPEIAGCAHVVVSETVYRLTGSKPVRLARATINSPSSLRWSGNWRVPSTR